jgi:hypothetical protein
MRWMVCSRFFVDEIDPDAGKTREHPRESKPALVGAAHAMSYLVFEGTSFGDHAFRRGQGVSDIGFRSLTYSGWNI